MAPARPIGLKHILSALLVAAITAPLAGQVVSYEGFGDYGADVQVESGGNGAPGTGLDGGFGWGGPYDVSNAIKSLVQVEDRTEAPGPVSYSNGEIVIAGGSRALRFYDIANGSSALQRPLGTSFSAAAGETLWFSVLFRTNSTSPLADRDSIQIGFDDAASSPNPRVSIGATNTSSTFPSPLQFFARSTSSLAASVFHDSPPIAAATTYLLVARIEPHGGVYDSVSLFVNPSSASDPGPPSASVTLPSGVSTLTHAIIRTANLDLNDAYVLDEWLVGRDYGSVAGSLRNALRILPASLPGGLPELRWSASLTGVVLETSTTLGTESWTEITGPFPLNAGDRVHAIPTDPGISHGFFRLRR